MGTIGEAGAGHAFAETTCLEKILLQATDEPVEQISSPFNLNQSINGCKVKIRLIAHRVTICVPITYDDIMRQGRISESTPPSNPD